MNKTKINANEKRAFLLANGKINKVILSLTIPSIIGMLINAVYNLTDTVFIGWLNDTPAMGAVSVSFPMFMIVTALGLCIGIGSGSFVSRCLGQNNKDIANKTVSIAFFTSITLGIIITILGLIFVKPLLRSMGATDTIYEYAKSYASILLIGSVFTILNMTLNNLIRAEGSSKYSMYAIMVGAVLNIILDPIFIFGFNMGVTGAAIATVIGQFVSTLFLLSFYYFKMGILSIKVKDFSFSKLIYLEILKIGLPTFITQFLTSYSISLLNKSASVYGDAAVAGIGIALRVNQLILFILIGYMQGFQPIVGYNYGAKRYDRLQETLKLSLIYTTVFSIIVTILLQIYATDIVKSFTSDIETIKVGVNQLIGVGLLRPILGFLFIYQGLFQGLGKYKQAGVLAIGRQGIFLISAIILLPKLFIKYSQNLTIFQNIMPYHNQPGLLGLAYTQTVADLIAVIVTLFFAIYIHKELRTAN